MIHSKRVFRTRWVAWSLACILVAAGCGEASRPPDVVFVSWDTTRADHVGPEASIPGLTPQWNRLAREGVRFDSARTVSPMTLPAHASLLTGDGPPGHGARLNSLFRLPDAAETVSERLAAAGWRTGAFVSAAVLAPGFGLAQGFETYDAKVTAGEGRSYAERPAEETVRRALDWLGSIPESEPVFLWVHLFDPHAPWEPPPEWALAHPDAPYRGEIAYTDAQTGRLLEGLRELGRLDHTLLAMTSDHGEGLGEHGEATHGYFLYDATVRIPLLFWAGPRAGFALPKDLRVDAPVLVSDIAPTVLELLGLPELPGTGASLAGWLRGENESARELAFESVDPYYAFGAAPAFGVVDSEGRVWIDLPQREHYDGREDPKQLHNLYSSALDDAADALFERHERRWPPPQSLAEPTEEAREQLAALGYVAARIGPGSRARTGVDPKELLPVAALWMGRHEDRRPDEALASAEALAAQFGPVPALAFFRADRLQELSRPLEAIEVLREAMAAFPAETRLREEIESLLAARAADQALAGQIRQALAADPEHPAAVHDLAVVLHRLGETEAAEGLYRRWLADHPEDTRTRLDLQRLLGAGGNFEAALSLLRVPTKRPRDPELACAEGRLLAWWMNRPDAAVPALRECASQGHELSARELGLLAAHEVPAAVAE